MKNLLVLLALIVCVLLAGCAGEPQIGEAGDDPPYEAVQTDISPREWVEKHVSTATSADGNVRLEYGSMAVSRRDEDDVESTENIPILALHTAGNQVEVSLADIESDKDEQSEVTHVIAGAVRPDGMVFAASPCRWFPVGAQYGKIFLWETSTQRLLRTFAHPSGIAASSIVFSPDGKRLAVAWDDSARVSLFEAESGKKLWTTDLTSTSDRDIRAVVQKLVFSPSGHQLLATGGFDHGESRYEEVGAFCKSLSAATGKAIDHSSLCPTKIVTQDGFKQPIVTIIDALAYSGDGRRIALALSDGAQDLHPRIEIRDASSFKRLFQYYLILDKTVSQIALDATGSHVAIATNERTLDGVIHGVIRYDVATQDVLDERVYREPVNYLAFSKVTPLLVGHDGKIEEIKR